MLNCRLLFQICELRSSLLLMMYARIVAIVISHFKLRMEGDTHLPLESCTALCYLNKFHQEKLQILSEV